MATVLFSGFTSSNPIWLHFLRSKCKNFAKCKHCDKVLSCKGCSTSSMKSHLISRHDINSKAFKTSSASESDTEIWFWAKGVRINGKKGQREKICHIGTFVRILERFSVYKKVDDFGVKINKKDITNLGKDMLIRLKETEENEEEEEDRMDFGKSLKT